MKQLFVLLACLLVSGGPVLSADPAAAKSAAHPVGLIDMAHVFKNYHKFSNMTESLQKEIEQVDADARSKVELMKKLQGQLTGGTLSEGSAEFARIEGELVKAQADMESFKRVAQREFLRKEADIYKTIYLEVEDAVSRYAKYYNYTIVLRFNRDQVGGAENPRDIINGMNRQVLYHLDQNDITVPILEYLNAEWDKQVGKKPEAPGPTATKPARPGGGLAR